MPRVKKCITCKQEIPEPRPFQKACSPKCAIDYTRTQEKKKRKQETRQMREAAKTKSQLLKEAQYEFNKYIRLRDKDDPCISCGRYHDGQYHAGHYRTVGSAPELRFHEDNCWKQCSACNNHLSGNLTEYRKALCHKLGDERVKWLEGPHEMPNWTHDEIRAIKQTYKDKTKALRGKDGEMQ